MGVSYPKRHFYPKSAPVTLENFFSCFCTGSHWTIFRLSPEKIFDLLTDLQPIEIPAKLKTKCKIWLKCQFLHTTINRRKILNAPLDALMCPLQIINWQWTLITDPSWCKHMLYPPPIQCRKLLDRPQVGNRWTKTPKKIVILDNIFLHLSANFEVEIQNTQCYRSQLTFWHLENRHLTAQQTAPRWDTQKSKIG